MLKQFLGLASMFAGLGAARSEAPAPEPRFKPYVDRIGMPHGRSGDKLVRKAMRGTVGLPGGRRGPLDGRPMPARYPFSAKRA